MKKIIMVILDGVGMREEKNGNAVKQASMNNFSKLWKEYPHSLLKASEKAVGLQRGQFGNSEVGHLTIGAGRLVKQKPSILEDLFENKKIKNNIMFQDMIQRTKEGNKTLHLMTMVSDGKVHSDINHLLKALEILKEQGVEKVVLHAITDGRDTETDVAYRYIKQVEEKMHEIGLGKIATVCGRYYAMDRDNNWSRTKNYYDLITNGTGVSINNIESAINACYKHNVTDEFLPPLVIDKNLTINNGDIVWWLNYRPDRSKQILRALKDRSMIEFPKKELSSIEVYTLFELEKKANAKVMLDDLEVTNPFGEYISNLGLTQARIAETEKYAHVTYFFDGGKELKLDNCDKFLVPSPKVATYDLKPEMSAVEITKKAIKCMEEDYDFIVINYANGDMVGHTGNMEATIKALEAVDVCLGKLLQTAEDNFYKMVILADHGNADIMIDENDKPVTSHTLSLVPFIITDKKLKLTNGDLTMVAPTVLKYMDISIPKEMKDTEILIDEE